MKKLSTPILKLASVIIIFLLGFLVYSNTFYNSFHFDDMYYIVNNPALRDVANLSNIWNTVSNPSRFVVFYTFALNYHFGGYEVFGYHVVNLIVHLIASGFVWWFILLLFDTHALKRLPIAKHQVLIAFIGGLIFVAHPIQTQAITYISQRFASMATMFYVGALCFYLKARLVNRFNIIFFIAAALFAVCAMFSKQIALTLPVAVLLCEFYFLRIKKGAKWKYIAPVLCFLLIVPACYSFDVVNMLTMQNSSGSHQGDYLTTKTYFLTSMRVLVTYLRLMFLPFGQNLDYDYPASYSLFETSTLFSFIGLLGLFLFALFKYKRYRLVSFCILWFFLTLSVESSIIVIQHVIFEHRLYLPMVGFSLFAATGLVYLLKDVKRIAIASILIVCFLSILTFNRNKVWLSDLSLWTDVMKKSPNKARPYISLAIAQIQRDELDAAMINLNKSIEIDSTAFKAFNNRGLVYSKKNDFERSLKDYNRAIDLDPYNAIVFNNRGEIYRELGDWDKALADYNQSLNLNPSYAQAYVNRGTWYGRQGQYEQAIADFNRAIKIHPRLHEAYNNRGVALNEVGEYLNAQEDLNTAIKLKENYAEAYYNRGNTFRNISDFTQAFNDYNRALFLKPDYFEVFNNRGIIYGARNQLDLAIADFNRAVKLNPKYAAAYFNRALAYLRQEEYEKALEDTLTAQELGKTINPQFIDQVKSLAQVQ